MRKVYTFSGGVLKVADRKFSNLKAEYEITFNQHSDIRPVVGEDNSQIKTIQYHFCKIKGIEGAEVNATVDVLCVVRSASDCAELVSQKQGGKVLYKRDLIVYDDSGCECRLTLWGDKAQADYKWSDEPILALKAVRVGEYNGKNLSLGNNSSFELNPDIPEAHALYKYKSTFNPSDLTTLSTAGLLTADTRIQRFDIFV